MFSVLQFFATLVATVVLPVYAPPRPPHPHPEKGSGKITFYDRAQSADAKLSFRVLDDNINGDHISYRYSNSLGL